jgi:hypothetical protein
MSTLTKSTLTKSNQRIALDARSATTIPVSPNSPPLRKNLATGERLSAPAVAPMSRRRIFAATEGPCRGEGCAKLLTLRIVKNCSQGFYLEGPVPASGLAAGILADFRKALAARSDASAANAATPIRFTQEAILHYIELIFLRYL